MFNHFFIVGAQRSGTTYLYRVLNSLPEVQMAVPEVPEPKFFLKEECIELGRDYYYASYFPNIPQGVKVLGEKSTSYYESELVPMRIKSMFPEAKIIFLLRNPVERAISNYFFSVQNGLESRSIDEVFLLDKPHPNIIKTTSVNPFDYLRRSMYSNYLTKYQSFFGDEIKVLITEQLTAKNNQTWIDLFSFLGVKGHQYNYFDIPVVNESKKVLVEPSLLEDIKRKITEDLKEEIAKVEELLNKEISQWRIKN